MKKLCKRCKKIVKRRNIITLSIMIPILLFLLSGLYIIAFKTQLLNSFLDSIAEKEFLNYAKSMENDLIVVKISEECNIDNKTMCVFNKTPMIVDYNKLDINFFDSIDIIKEPSQYFMDGGVCRDVSVIRYSILNRLGIYCYFNFSIKNHVFLVCEENDKIYILNNDKMTIIY